LYINKTVKNVIVTDVSGKIMFTNDNVDTIDLSNFNSGIYFIHMRFDNGIKKVKKIIKI